MKVRWWGWLGSGRGLAPLPTRGPSWVHPTVVLGTIRSFLEPFCGHFLPKIDKVSEETTLRHPPEGPCMVFFPRGYPGENSSGRVFMINSRLNKNYYTPGSYQSLLNIFWYKLVSNRWTYRLFIKILAEIRLQ